MLLAGILKPLNEHQATGDHVQSEKSAFRKGAFGKMTADCPDPRANLAQILTCASGARLTATAHGFAALLRFVRARRPGSPVRYDVQNIAEPTQNFPH